MTLRELREAFRKAYVSEPTLWMSTNDGEYDCIRVLVPRRGSKKLAKMLRAALQPCGATKEHEQK